MLNILRDLTFKMRYRLDFFLYCIRLLKKIINTKDVDTREYKDRTKLLCGSIFLITSKIYEHKQTSISCLISSSYYCYTKE